jgi:phosphotransferase system HPr (HPr) family protein
MSSRVTGSGQVPRDAVPALPAAAPQPAPPPSGPLRRTVRITNPLGLHQRAADRFHRAAKTYGCAVTVWNGERRADGKSITDLMLLLVFPDTEVILEVDGPDAPAALGALAEILGSPGGEDYVI